MNMNQIASGLYNALTESDERKPKPYDTKAEVLRVEGETVWVKIPGGIDETPVSRTNNANPGDQVMVRISGGRAWLLGNQTNPATDDKVAIQAGESAGAAMERASNAAMAAEVAEKAAESAIADAATASVKAEEASGDASRAQQAATEAGLAARSAESSASDARIAADVSLDQLAIIENVVGVLSLLQKHGDYRITNDSDVIIDKWYFIRTGSGTTADPFEYTVITNNNITSEYFLTEDEEIVQGKKYYTRSGTQGSYVYTEVVSPRVEDIRSYYEYSRSPHLHGYYELIGIDRAVQNYVTSQLVLDGNSLWLKSEGIMKTKMQLSSTDGIILYGPDGSIVGKYGPAAQIGNENGFHIKITDQKLSFYEQGQEVAYMSNQQLYITKSVVLTQMDVGTPEKGVWSWRVHDNANNKNNYYLKWLG